MREKIIKEMDNLINYYRGVISYSDFTVCYHDDKYLVLTNKAYDNLSNRYKKIIQYEYNVINGSEV